MWAIADFFYRLIKMALIASTAIAAIVFGIDYIASNRGFTDDEIANIERSIREKFLDRGAETARASMIREHSDPFKLTGMVTVRIKGAGEITKSCHATMGDSGQSIWGCD